MMIPFFWYVSNTSLYGWNLMEKITFSLLPFFLSSFCYFFLSLIFLLLLSFILSFFLPLRTFMPPEEEMCSNLVFYFDLSFVGNILLFSPFLSILSSLTLSLSLSLCSRESITNQERERERERVERERINFDRIFSSCSIKLMCCCKCV